VSDWLARAATALLGGPLLLLVLAVPPVAVWAVVDRVSEVRRGRAGRRRVAEAVQVETVRRLVPDQKRRGGS
jgi:hypothetical protein